MPRRPRIVLRERLSALVSYVPIFLPPLGLVLLLGLSLRLLLSLEPGNGFDVGINQGWGLSAVKLGLARSYVEQVNGNMIPNYPPLGLMIFSWVGHLYQFFVSADFDTSLLAYRVAIKLPAIFADLATTAMLYSVVRFWKNETQGIVAAVIYALHPAVLYDSAVWGQTDSVFTMFMVAALWEHSRGRWYLSPANAALAILAKAQAIMLYPFFAVIYTRTLSTFIRGLAVGLAMIALVLAPYMIGGTLEAALNVYRTSVGFYPIVSSAAYNFWWALFADQAMQMNDHDLFFDLIAYRTLGYTIFFSIYGIVIATLWRHLRAEPSKTTGLVLFSAAAIFAQAFFLFNTEMHERYLFPYVAFGLPMAFLGRKQAMAYAAVSLLFLWNMLGWLPYTEFDRQVYSRIPMFDVGVAWSQLFLFFMQLKWTLDLRHLPVSKPTKKRLFFRQIVTLLRGWLPKVRKT
jgi:Gpi18-like mannosyltransferase